MGKKEVLLIVLALAFLISPILASAVGDVAYIYRKTFKVDDNILDAFNDAGLTVDLIDEQELPVDFSQYKLLFVGDENFRRENLIPVNDYPTIVANYYHTHFWGLTDEDGTSQLAANHPLSVKKDNQLIQVYTEASKGQGGPSLPYYFLDKENIAPSLETVALTETTSSGENFGDVISRASVGSQMLNGETQNGKLCFFGIIETDYWTSGARSLFDECIGYVAAECVDNSDCPSPETSEPFCHEGDVYITETSYTCENGAVTAQCVSDDSLVLEETCDYGCDNGECIIPPCVTDEDCNDYNSSTEDTCHNPGQENAYCTNELITCFTNSDCGTNGFIDEPLCSGNDVTRTYRSYLCLEPGTASSSCSFSDEEQTIETCIGICTNGECESVTCYSDSDCDDTNPLTFDECINPGQIISECRNTLINCASDNDCGFTGFIGEEFCSQDNVVKNFQNSTCLNPGTLQSSCSVESAPRLITECSVTCSDGICITCQTNADCDDDNELTQDICINPDTPESYCENNPIEIECTVSSDCGINSFIGDQFCSNGDVMQYFRVHTCNNPGLTESYCSYEDREELIQSCTYGCSNAECIEEVTCTTDLDCGETTVISSPFCYVNDINELILEWTCNNLDTIESYCSSNITSNIIDSCPEYCSDGECVSIECFTHEDCDDFDETTLDICNNPGTPQSYCTNNPIEIICSSDSDCGTDGFVGEDFCIGNNVTSLYEEYTCHAPNTPQSFCSSTISQVTVEECLFICSDGECVIEGECNPGETRPCGYNNVGECQLGVETCGPDRFFGSCQGAIYPESEMCDFLDNDCDGLINEDFPNLGDSCVSGIGQCESPGNYVCSQDGLSAECNAIPNPPQDELCDNLDNDCDGSIIDDGEDETWYNQGTTCGLGVCEDTGTLICDNGIQTDTCVEGTPTDELCDFLDNDCDGEIDEIFLNLGDICSLGLGICENSGLFVCSLDQLSTECNAVPDPPETEICNSLDDDCDGQIDEGGVCAYCGDNNLDPGEQCDDGILNGLPGFCKTDCTGTVACYDNDDCDDSNSQTQDNCINPGTINSYCQNIPPSPECDDGIDNDHDGLADWPADPGCDDRHDNDETDPVTTPECDDGIDNDHDGWIDWPMDPGCTDRNDNSEHDPSEPPQCDDGYDNDHDGKIDWPADPQCNDRNDDNESL